MDLKKMVTTLRTNVENIIEGDVKKKVVVRVFNKDNRSVFYCKCREPIFDYFEDYFEISCNCNGTTTTVFHFYTENIEEYTSDNYTYIHIRLNSK